MKLLVIYNQHAGKGRAKGLLPKISRYLESQVDEVSLKTTEFPGHGVELAQGSDLKHFDAVIAAGGDGTLFEVVNGYMNNASVSDSEKPPLGLIPNGTGNAFMKELGLTKDDWKKAIDIICGNQIRRIDIGKLTTDNKALYFINIVGVGFVSEVAQAANNWKWLGNAAYTIGTLQKLIGLKSHKMTITADTEVLEFDAVFAEVANSRYTGTTFLMAPKATLDDGLLDLVVLKDISRIKILKLFTSIYDGSHVNYPEVEYIQAKKITIEENTPSKLVPDGEIMELTPVEFECLPKAIRFLWPVH